MTCPKCQLDNDRVIDSRDKFGGKIRRRRHLCLNAECGNRWTTYELPKELIDECLSVIGTYLAIEEACKSIEGTARPLVTQLFDA